MKILGILTVLFFAIVSMAQAANIVDMIATGPGVVADTFFSHQPVEIQISIGNDLHIAGMGLAFQVWSPDGAEWDWEDVGGYGTSGSVTVFEWCHMYPPDSIWDIGGLLVSDTNINNGLPDTILISGLAVAGGLQPGPLRHMFSMHGKPKGTEPYELSTLCFDSVFVPPSGSFIFIGNAGNTIPSIGWNEGGKCYIVSMFCADIPYLINPDENEDSTVSVPLNTVYVENVGGWENVFGLITIQLLSVNNGTGEATVEDNGDGTCNIKYITPLADVGQQVEIVVAAYDEVCFTTEPSQNFTLKIDVIDFVAGDFNGDVQANLGDVVYMVNYIFRGGPPPVDLACSDVNNDCEVNIGDGIFVINYIFRGGPVPTCSDCMD
ncbi:MAG: hypothetical protein KAR42_01245 [candidate division Zixibacteria bacterium]|nr:hypothetical protein [candidate division Zixibacteria bacterium]